MGMLVVGLSHRSAPLELREQVVYSRQEALATLRALKEHHDIPQALLLSTCNRTEVYALPNNGNGPESLQEAVFWPKLRNSGERTGTCLYTLGEEHAVEHLFRVACGLDSMVLGEQQVLGQVKEAYELSRDAATAGTIMHRLVHAAVRTGKKARTTTNIGLGAVSVGSIAVELAEKVLEDLKGRGALLVGAGENGKVCAHHLLARRVEPLLIANRTGAKAENLASALGGERVAMTDLSEALSRVDIVVSTTGSPEPVIHARQVRAAMRKRSGRALVLLDIAMPRDIDPAVDAVPNVFRFDMDALQGVADRNLAARRCEIPAVEQLIGHEVRNFMRWWAGLDAGPVIRDLHQAFEDIRAAELRKNAKRFADVDQEQLEIFSRNLVRKFLMGLTCEIKQYRLDNPVEGERLATLRHLFRLDVEATQRTQSSKAPRT